jgi:hypothetical protein
VFPALVLFLSSRYTVALRCEDLPGFDGAAYCAPLLFDRARSSETEGVDFVTVAIGRLSLLNRFRNLRRCLFRYASRVLRAPSKVGAFGCHNSGLRSPGSYLMSPRTYQINRLNR